MNFSQEIYLSRAYPWANRAMLAGRGARSRWPMRPAPLNQSSRLRQLRSRTAECYRTCGNVPERMSWLLPPKPSPLGSISERCVFTRFRVLFSGFGLRLKFALHSLRNLFLLLFFALLFFLPFFE